MAFIRDKWEQLGRPCSAQAVTYALGCAEHRIAAHDDARSVLVHGDIHTWNALQSTDGYKLIDPDGLRAEPEYDLGVIMREDPDALLAGDPSDQARWLAHHTGRDATATWEWGVVETLSTALVCTELAIEPYARQMLAAAEHNARAG
jgi:streptomycin 6-kinase